MRQNKILLLFFFIYSQSYFSYTQRFTLAVIPDTQHCTYYRHQKSYKDYPLNLADVFYREMQYIADNSIKNGGNIIFAIHLGDVVNSYGRQVSEWESANKAFSVIEGIVPFGVVPGDHDYDELYSIKGGKNNKIEGGQFFNQYFGANSHFFLDKDWYGGCSPNGLSSWSRIISDETNMMFLGLEYEPSNETLLWAQSVIDENPKLPIILVTHEYLYAVYDSYNPGNAAFNRGTKYIEMEGRNKPEQIWNNFIKKNKNIFLVLCGHSFDGKTGESARTDVNDDGYKVYSLLSNYQQRDEVFENINYTKETTLCGDGWIRLLDFNLAKKQIHVQTYSTEFNRYEKDADSDFFIKFDWDWNERFGISEVQ